MATPDPSVLGRLRLAGSADESDATLLDRFARQRDEAAFAALVGRHGPMVLGVCRRTLGDAHAAEDAFQAAFLVFAKKAGSLARPETLAGWLHGVARRVALKTRAARAGRGSPLPSEEAAPPDRSGDPLAELTGRELLAILEAEVQRLPSVYRLPVALCCLEGLTQEEAARRLGVSAAAVRGRLERGRARLSARLARRGLLPTAVLAVAGFARVANAGVPAGLATLTTRAAGRYVTEAGAGGGAVPATPRLLAEGVLNAMLVSKLKRTAAAVLAAVLALAGSAAVGQYGPDGDPSRPARGVEAESPVPRPMGGARPVAEPPAVERKLHGRWVGRGLVPVVFTFRADGTFERSVLDQKCEGTWAMSWDALPPTLRMRYTKSDDPALTNTTFERKVVQLDDAVWAIENPEGLRPIGYTRVKP